MTTTLPSPGEATLTDTRRAPVQSEWHKCRMVRPSGTVSWPEHQQAWQEYNKRWRGHQSAERIAERGGFGYAEITSLLGREPTTWQERKV
jgi:hypothetical protein